MNMQKSLNTHPSTLNLVLTRIRTRGEYTHGHLTINGIRVCDTLENANAQVPAGKYVITLVKCKHHGRKMPCLNLSNLEPETWNLKQRCAECKRLPFVCNNTTLPCRCPMIKPGNGIHSRLDGSILVGKYNCVNCLLHPKSTFDPLYERIRKSIPRGKHVLLSVY